MNTPPWRIGIVVLLLLSSSTHASSPTIDEVVTGMGKAERRLRNLRVDGECWDEEKDGAGSNSRWKKTQNYTKATFWSDGFPGGRARIDVAKDVITWQGGEAPYLERSYSVAFNGQVCKTIHFSEGPIGEMGRPYEAQISASRNAELESVSCRMVSGELFSTYLWYDPKGQSLSMFLEAFLKYVRKLPSHVESVEEVTLDSQQALKLVIGAEDQKARVWWVIPTNGYAILAYKSAATMNDYTLYVQELVEAGPGVWYPRQAYYNYPSTADGAVRRRAIYKTSAVVANDPKFDDHVFDLRIPGGYSVTDKITGKTFRTAPTTQDLDKELQKAVDEARNAGGDTSRP